MSNAGNDNVNQPPPPDADADPIEPPVQQPEVQLQQMANSIQAIAAILQNLIQAGPAVLAQPLAPIPPVAPAPPAVPPGPEPAIPEPPADDTNRRTGAVIKQQPPVYRGDVTQAMDWLRHYKKVACTNGWDTKQQAQYLYTALQGPASSWYTSTFPGGARSFEEFEIKFMKERVPTNLVAARKAAFFAMRPEMNEAPLNFLDRLREAALESDVTESDVVETFRRRAPDSISQVISAMNTMDDLRQCLLNACAKRPHPEVYTDVQRYKHQRHRREYHRNHPYDRQERRPDHIERRHDYQMRRDDRPDAPRRYPPPPLEPNAAPRPTEGAVVPYTGRRPSCWNCGEAHILRHCPHEKDQTKIRINKELHEARRVSGSGQNNNNGRPAEGQTGSTNAVVRTFAGAPRATVNTSAPYCWSFEERPVGDRIRLIVGQHNSLTRIILVGHLRVEALFDTGGTISLISSALARRLGRPMAPWRHGELRGISSYVRPHGIIGGINVVFGAVTVHLDATVIGGLVPHVILGMDYLRSAGVEIDLANNCITTGRHRLDVHNSNQPYAVRDATPDERRHATTGSVWRGTTDPSMAANEKAPSALAYWSTLEGCVTADISLGPRRAKVVDLEVKPGPADGEYFVKPHPDFEGDGVMIQEGVTRVVQARFRAVIVNRTAYSALILTGQRVARVQRIDGDVIECPRIRCPAPAKGYVDVQLAAVFGDEAPDEAEEAIPVVTAAHEATVPEPHVTNDEVLKYLNEFKCGEQLTYEERLRLGRLLLRYRDRFVFTGDALGKIPFIMHQIETGDHAAISTSPYRVSVAEKKAIEEHVQKMLDQGIIQPSASAWASPVVIVSKRDKSLRFCVDYRKLNAITKPDNYPLPRLDDALDMLGDCDLYSTMDACSAYWQIAMHPDSVEKTTFTCHMGTYAFRFMPFGLRNAPATCSRAMARIFSRENGRICIIYLDDCITFSRGFDQHLARLEIILLRAREGDVKLNPKKCFFVMRKVAFLGHEVSPEGIRPDPERVATLLHYPTPMNRRDVRSFLGFTSFYRRHIPRYAQISRPLRDLTALKVDFKWEQEQEDSFRALQNAVLAAPVLVHFDPDAEYVLRTDACLDGIAGHLVLIPAGASRREARLFACCSRGLSKEEKRYPVSHLECLAIVFSISKFRPYLYGRAFVVETDHHALCFLMKVRDPNGRLCRWAQLLQAYDFKIVYNQGKNHQDADCLSRHALPAQKQDIEKDFFDTMLDQFQAYQFSASASDREVLTSAEDVSMGEGAERSVAGSQLDRSDDDLKSASENDVSSSSGSTTETCWTDYMYPEIEHKIPSGEVLTEQLEEIIRKCSPTDSFFGPIYQALENGTGNEYLKKYFTVKKGVLMRIKIDQDCQRELLCIPAKAVSAVLAAVHDSDFGGHFGVKRTYSRLKHIFYWPRMMEAVREYVKTCLLCQFGKGTGDTRAGLYQLMPHAIEPFRDIAADCIGPIHPMTSYNNRYLLTIVCRATRFATAVPLTDIESSRVIAELYAYFMRHGVPNTLLTDRGTNFTGKEMTEFLGQYKVRHLLTSAGHPCTNGVNERFNRTIGTALRVRQNPSDWDVASGSLTYAYNATPHTRLGYSPYYLVYGQEARQLFHNTLPVVPGWTSVLEFDDRLVALIIARESAHRRSERAQRENKRRMDQKRKTVTYEIGEMVLVYEPTVVKTRGAKLKSRFTGPYVVTAHCSENVYSVARPEGEAKVRVVNVKRLKRFYPREEWTTCETDSSTAEDSAGSGTDADTETSITSGAAIADARPIRQRRRPARYDEFICAKYDAPYGPLP